MMASGTVWQTCTEFGHVDSHCGAQNFPFKLLRYTDLGRDVPVME